MLTSSLVIFPPSIITRDSTNMSVAEAPKSRSFIKSIILTMILLRTSGISDGKMPRTITDVFTSLFTNLFTVKFCTGGYEDVRAIREWQLPFDNLK
jgi:hypothetical protein